jgi:hypothetical protein
MEEWLNDSQIVEIKELLFFATFIVEAFDVNFR